MTSSREFNLDEILGPEYVRHYLRFIHGAGETFYVGPDRPKPDKPWRETIPPSRTDSTDDRPRSDIEHIGYGPDLCSTSVALDIVPGFVWDVCGYYRRLGLGTHWWATRPEILAAGQARGALHRPRLLYALNQLLSRKVRRSYDRAVPTEPWLLDQETNDGLKAAAAMAAARHNAAHGGAMSSDDVLAEWGLKQRSTREEAMAGQAPDAMTPLPGQPLGYSVRGWIGQWSYYIMGEADWDLTETETGEMLAVWQRMIREELADRGEVTRFAVGLCRGTWLKLWPLSGGECIVFLGRDQQLTSRAVRQAADRILDTRRPPNGNAERLR